MKVKKNVTYQALLKKYNKDKHLKTMLNYFEHNSIMLFFLNTLLDNYDQKIISKKRFKKFQKISRFLLVNQVLATDEFETDKFIDDIYLENPEFNREIFNFEQQLVDEFNLSSKQISDYFCYHKQYGLVANVYGSSFKNLTNYREFLDFFYLLIMYINLEFSYNKFIILEDYQPFILKLALQNKMIETLSELIPQDYNLLIRKLNRWFNHKALYKVIRQIPKIKEDIG